MGTRIQMVATSAGGSESGLAAIDIPLNGVIESVAWAVRSTIDTTADSGLWQLSFGSVLSVVNDSRQVISNLSMGIHTFLTSVGDAFGGANFLDLSPDIPVTMGERLFLHASHSANVVSVAVVLISFDFDLDKPAARRR